MRQTFDGTSPSRRSGEMLMESPRDEARFLTAEERRQRNYRHAAHLLRSMTSGSLSRQRVRDGWPRPGDPSLKAARELADLWFFSQTRLDLTEIAGLAADIERCAVELDAGRSLVDESTDRWWRWSVIFADNRNGLIFLALALAAIGLLGWWILSGLT
jgi:hypothetical protein